MSSGSTQCPICKGFHFQHSDICCWCLVEMNKPTPPAPQSERIAKLASEMADESPTEPEADELRTEKEKGRDKNPSLNSDWPVKANSTDVTRMHLNSTELNAGESTPDERRDAIFREKFCEPKDACNGSYERFCAGWDAREPEIADLNAAIEEQMGLSVKYQTECHRLERELAEMTKAHKELSVRVRASADATLVVENDRLTKELAELRNKYLKHDMENIPALERERNDLRAAAEENERAFQALDKAHDNCVIARNELKARAEAAEKSEQFYVERYDNVELLAEKLAGALEASFEDYIGYNDCSGMWDADDGMLLQHSENCLKCIMANALAEWAKFKK